MRVMKMARSMVMLLAGFTGFSQVAGRGAKRFVEVVVGQILYVYVVASHLLDKLEADLEVGELVVDDLERVRDGVERVLLSVEECHGKERLAGPALACGFPAFPFPPDRARAKTRLPLLVRLSLGMGCRGLEVAASGGVVFCTTFGGKSGTLGDRELLAATNG